MKLFKYLSIFLLICSCGFKPMYKETPYNNLSEKTASIAISPVKVFDGAYGVELRNKLLNKLTPLGKPENPKYILDITLSEPNILDYTIKTDGTASSYLVKMYAVYTLKQKKDFKVLFTKTANAEISYNILKNQFSTEMLKKNAIKLTIDDLANQIYFAVITYFTER